MLYIRETNITFFWIRGKKQYYQNNSDGEGADNYQFKKKGGFQNYTGDKSYNSDSEANYSNYNRANYNQNYNNKSYNNNSSYNNSSSNNNSENYIRNCPNCSAPMRLLMNKAKNTYFIGCSNYPNCKNTISIDNPVICKISNNKCFKCSQGGREIFKYEVSQSENSQKDYICLYNCLNDNQRRNQYNNNQYNNNYNNQGGYKRKSDNNTGGNGYNGKYNKKRARPKKQKISKGEVEYNDDDMDFDEF